jgi:peptidoglycan/xylan/chitin deacetylase (PgdA/CDA1 family)
VLHQYFIKTPWWVKDLFPAYTWHMSREEKTLYLTFDDGPHPEITPFVMEELKKVEAQASFFCIGNNVRQYPSIVQTIIQEGHSIGNHTQNHLNGWKTETDAYLDDVAEASKWICTDLFRPPYGRLKRSQAKGIGSAMSRPKARVIMWDVLSADFDRTITKEQCLKQVLKYAENGSIIVFHDSEKAFSHLSYVLPKALARWQSDGYKFAHL